MAELHIQDQIVDEPHAVPELMALKRHWERIVEHRLDEMLEDPASSITWDLLKDQIKA